MFFMGLRCGTVDQDIIQVYKAKAGQSTPEHAIHEPLEIAGSIDQTKGNNSVFIKPPTGSSSTAWASRPRHVGNVGPYIYNYILKGEATKDISCNPSPPGACMTRAYQGHNSTMTGWRQASQDRKLWPHSIQLSIGVGAGTYRTTHTASSSMGHVQLTSHMRQESHPTLHTPAKDRWTGKDKQDKSLLTSLRQTLIYSISLAISMLPYAGLSITLSS